GGRCQPNLRLCVRLPGARGSQPVFELSWRLCRSPRGGGSQGGAITIASSGSGTSATTTACSRTSAEPIPHSSSFLGSDGASPDLRGFSAHPASSATGSDAHSASLTLVLRGSGVLGSRTPVWLER